MEELFCLNCENLLITKIGYNEAKDQSKLIYYCKNCNESFDKSDKGASVYHLNYNLDNIKRKHIVNKYTAYDTTLPKATGIKCPNENCPSKRADIRYIKYDDDKMKYIYICIDCKNADIEPNMW